MPDKSLTIQDNIKIKLNKFRSVKNVDKLFLKDIFFFIIFVFNIREKMNSKPFNLIPDCIELFEVIFENFILRAFDTKFISRY